MFTYVLDLPYQTKVWQEQWPKVMSNVIRACEEVQARLIFLDNIYMYGPKPLRTPITETHSQDPPSEKGKVRKTIADMLMAAHHSGKVKAVIGRSADFYGPHVINSPLYYSFLERMLKGKDPQSLSKTNIQHTYAYTKDNGRALVALAMDHNTYGQVWHLPVSKPVTMDEVLSVINNVLGTDFKVSVVPRFALSIMGIFIPAIREVMEMAYQMEHPYIVSDEKFRKHFPEFLVTNIEEGIKEMINSFT